MKFTFSCRPCFSYERSNTNIRSRPIDDKDKGNRIRRNSFLFQERERKKRRTDGRVVKRNVVNEERRKNSAV